MDLAPVSRDSGTLRGRRSAVRAALFMAILVASRRNPVIASYDNKLPATGKPAKQSLVACMRKLLVILDAILRDQNRGKPLDPQHSRSGIQRSGNKQAERRPSPVRRPSL